MSDKVKKYSEKGKLSILIFSFLMSQLKTSRSTPSIKSAPDEGCSNRGFDMYTLSTASLKFQSDTRSANNAISLQSSDPPNVEDRTIYPFGHILGNSQRKPDKPCRRCDCYKCYVKQSMPEYSSHDAGILPRRQLYLSRAKLKASSRTSALLSGFAMVALVELQFNGGSKVPSSLLVAFSVCTTLLVAIHLLALMISTCILPHVEAVSEIHSDSAINESPHKAMHWYIEIAWASSTVFGIFLFLIEIVIVCWVKFIDFSTDAALAATIVLVPILIIFFAFAVHFYRKLVSHKYQLSESGIRELEDLKNRLESGNLDNPNTPFAGGFA